MKELARYKVWIQLCDREILQLETTLAKIRLERAKFQEEVNKLTEAHSQGAECPQALGL